MTRTHSEAIVAVGERVWGDRWASAMSRFTDVNLRTLTRIHAAAREGREYPAARGVVAALHDRLTGALDDLTARRREPP
jgi:hypothetical protein